MHTNKQTNPNSFSTKGHKVLLRRASPIRRAFHSFFNLRKGEMTNVGGDVEMFELLCIASGAAPLENSLPVAQKIKHELLCDQFHS